MEDFKITIPEVTDAKVKVFLDDEFIGEATCEQVNKIRINIVKHILKTKDNSILDKFYLIGHTDNNIRMGEEIKITMDKAGNLSDLPWELAHTRRDMLYLIDLEHKGLAHCELHYGR